MKKHRKVITHAEKKITEEEFLEKIRKLWNLNPDLTFGQLIGNAFPHSLYWANDKDLIKALEFTYGVKL